MTIDVSEQTILDYQSTRLKDKASPKTINEEVGFLLRVLENRGDAIRARLRRRKQLKLAVKQQVGKAFSPDEKRLLYEQVSGVNYFSRSTTTIIPDRRQLNSMEP